MNLNAMSTSTKKNGEIPTGKPPPILTTEAAWKTDTKIAQGTRNPGRIRNTARLNGIITNPIDVIVMTRSALQVEPSEHLFGAGQMEQCATGFQNPSPGTCHECTRDLIPRAWNIPPLRSGHSLASDRSGRASRIERARHSRHSFQLRPVPRDAAPRDSYLLSGHSAVAGVRRGSSLSRFRPPVLYEGLRLLEVCSCWQHIADRAPVCFSVSLPHSGPSFGTCTP